MWKYIFRKRLRHYVKSNRSSYCCPFIFLTISQFQNRTSPQCYASCARPVRQQPWLHCPAELQLRPICSYFISYQHLKWSNPIYFLMDSHFIMISLCVLFPYWFSPSLAHISHAMPLSLGDFKDFTRTNTLTTVESEKLYFGGFNSFS